MKVDRFFLFKALFSRYHLVIILLLIMITVSGIVVCYLNYEKIKYYTQLQHEMNIENKLKIQWSKLLLEYSTLTGPLYVAKVARSKLNMEYPKIDHIKIVSE